MSYCPSSDNNIKDAVARIGALGIYKTLRRDDGVLSRSLIRLHTVEVLYLVPRALRGARGPPRSHFNKVSMATWPLLQVVEDAQLEGAGHKCLHISSKHQDTDVL